MKAVTIKHTFLIAMMTITSIVQAQTTDEKALVTQMVEERNFIFKAEMVMPQAGRSRPLTSEYDLTVSRDSVISFLPYFGRAYVAPVNSSEGGIKFTSTQFEYKNVAGKKEGWQITIIPRDAGSVQQLYLTIFENGRANLLVNDRNRQNISFTGYIVQGTPKEKRAF